MRSAKSLATAWSLGISRFSGTPRSWPSSAFKTTAPALISTNAAFKVCPVVARQRRGARGSSPCPRALAMPIAKTTIAAAAIRIKLLVFMLSPSCLLLVWN